MIIKAHEGKVFRRIDTGFIMGNEINLGYDNTHHNLTGEIRNDLPQYYEEIDEPIEETLNNEHRSNNE